MGVNDGLHLSMRGGRDGEGKEGLLSSQGLCSSVSQTLPQRPFQVLP